MIAAAEFHSPVVKNKVLNLFQGPLSYEDQRPSVSLLLSFNFDQSRTYLYAKIGCWHANKSKNRLLTDISVFR